MISQYRFPRVIFARALSLSLVLAAPLAAAQNNISSKPANSGKGKFTKQETEVKATQTNLTKPEAPPPPKKETGPTLTVDQFVEQKTGRDPEDHRRADQQDAAPHPGHPGRRPAEAGLLLPARRALRREAALQLQPGARARSEDLRAAAGQRGDAAVAAEGLRAGQEQKWLLEAVKAYIGATKFKKYERMDEVLFKLAYLLTSVKKEDQAREFFLRLIKDYPNSKYIPDAYLSFAEFYFDKGEMDNALKFYEKVEQFPKSSVYPLRRLQKGLVLRQPGRLQDGARDLRRRRSHGPGGQGQHQRGAEAGAEQGSQEGHRQGLLARRRPRQGLGVLPAHGRRLRAEDDGGAGRAVLGAGQVRRLEPRLPKIISQNMDSPRICEWQNKIVRNTLSAGTKRDQVQEIERLGAVYDKVAEMKGVKKDQMEECRTPSTTRPRSWRSSGTRKRRRPRTPTRTAGQVRLQGVPRPLPEGQGRLRHGLLLRRAALDARAAGRTPPSSTPRSSR